MEDTYTYIARNADNPEEVITFTIRGTDLTLQPGAALEKVEQAVAASLDEEVEGPSTSAWLKPLTLSLAERGTHPFNLTDITAMAEGDYLRVGAWIRTAGLRLAPVSLVAWHVDNPEAAQAFVEEIETRQEALGRPGFLFGWLDYWFTWILTAVVVLGLLEGWRRRRQGETT